MQWIQELEGFLRPCAGLKPGADIASLDALEAGLGLSLAPGHRAFLAFSDGAENWGALGEIYSCQRLLERARETGFSSQTDGPELRVTGDYYAHLPRRQLIIAQHPLGADVWCLDTRFGPEYPVTHYDAENDAERHQQQRYPHFEALLRAELETLYEFWLDEHDEDEALYQRLLALMGA